MAMPQAPPQYMLIPATAVLPGGSIFTVAQIGKQASLVAQLVKNLPQCGRPQFDPRLGRSPGEGKGYPLQSSGLENSMDGPWGHKELDMTE